MLQLPAGLLELICNSLQAKSLALFCQCCSDMRQTVCSPKLLKQLVKLRQQSLTLDPEQHITSLLVAPPASPLLQPVPYISPAMSLLHPSCFRTMLRTTAQAFSMSGSSDPHSVFHG